MFDVDFPTGYFPSYFKCLGAGEPAAALENLDIGALPVAPLDHGGIGVHLFEGALYDEGDPVYAARAARLAASVRDISEVLADRGPRRGGSMGLTVTADAPCHLLHAQGIARAPAAVLDAVPGLALVPLRAADECCGGAGIYGITHPDLGGRIGADKVAAVVETQADAVVSGNVGCIMQIGAGLRMAKTACQALHPVELLDESYRRAGLYRSER